MFLWGCLLWAELLIEKDLAAFQEGRQGRDSSGHSRMPKAVKAWVPRTGVAGGTFAGRADDGHSPPPLIFENWAEKWWHRGFLSDSTLRDTEQRLASLFLFIFIELRAHKGKAYPLWRPLDGWEAGPKPEPKSSDSPPLARTLKAGFMVWRQHHGSSIYPVWGLPGAPLNPWKESNTVHPLAFGAVLKHMRWRWVKK